MNTGDYQGAIERELQSWPGVTVEFVSTGKHPKAKLWFGGKMLSRPFAGTPSDSVFGVHKMLGDVRRTLKQLGAERDKPEPSKDEDEAPYRKPNEGREKRPDPVKGEPAKVKPDTADQLVKAGAVTEEQATVARAEKAAPIIAQDDDEEDADDQAEAKAAALQARADEVVDGIYFGMPAEVYHKVRRLSTSALQRIDVSPADFWKDSWLDPNPTVLTEDQEKRQSIARVIGAAYHTARLEPHLFEALYVRELDRRDFPRKGLVATDTAVKAALKALGQTQSIGTETAAERAQRLADAGYEGTILALHQAEWEANLGGRISLSPVVYDEIVIDMTRIHSSGDVAGKLTGGAAEVSIFWTDAHGLKMKARVDYLRSDLWADFKTFANPRRKQVKQVISDAFRYDRYHMQWAVYRDAIEHVRVEGLQIIGDATDDERRLIAEIQITPGELECWYIFQQKGGVPNLLLRRVEGFEIPFETQQLLPTATPKQAADLIRTSRRKTLLHVRAHADVERCKEQFVLYSQVYAPGEPWRPIEPEGTFGDIDFNTYWLEGKAA